MKVRYITCLMLLMGAANLALGQTANIDSLESLLSGSTLSKTEAIEVNVKLANNYSYFDSLKTVEAANRAHALAQEIGDDFGQYSALAQVVNLYFELDQIKAAQDTLLWGLSKTKRKKHKKSRAVLTNLLGQSLFKEGQIDSARYYFNEYMQLAIELKDSVELADAHLSMASFHKSKDDTYSMVTDLLMAKNISEMSKNRSMQVKSLTHLALAYDSLNQFEYAFAYMKEANELTNYANIHEEWVTKIIIGDNYTYRQEFDKAKEYLSEAYLLANSFFTPKRLYSSNIELGINYHDNKKYDSALIYFNKALELAESHAELDVFYAYRNLINSYLELNNLTEAEALLIKAKKLAEVEVDESDDKDHDFTLKYDFAKLREKQGRYKESMQYWRSILDVRESAGEEYSQISLERANAEKDFIQKKDSTVLAQKIERAKIKANIKAQEPVQKAAIIGIIICAVLLIFIIIINRRNVLKNRKLNEYNKTIQSKNAEITQGNNQLDGLNLALEKANQTKTRFFSIVSHDLRGPVGSIISLMNLVKIDLEEKQGHKLKGDLKEFMEHMDGAGKQVVNLLDGLVKWAMKEEGKILIKPELTNVIDSFRETQKILYLQAVSKSIQLQLEVEEGLQIWVDKNSFKTILRNLVSNAIKFTPKEGRITLKAHTIGKNVEIKVIDTGIGIPQKNLDSLFEIDETKVRTGTNHEKGTGLGLNLVYDFVEMNDGEIKVESTEGKGTTFTLIFEAIESKEMNMTG